MIVKKLKLALPFLLLTICSTAQTADEQYAKALKLKTEYNYKDALTAFQAFKASL